MKTITVQDLIDRLKLTPQEERKHADLIAECLAREAILKDTRENTEKNIQDLHKASEEFFKAMKNLAALVEAFVKIMKAQRAFRLPEDNRNLH